MNILDLIIVVIVALSGWNGYRLGLFRQVTRLFGAVIAYGIALWLRPYLTPVIEGFVQNAHWSTSQAAMLHLFLGNLSGAISFTIVFLVSFVILRYTAGLVDALFSLPLLSTVNRLAGMVAGLILAIVLVYVISLVAHYVNNPRVQSELSHSAIVQFLDANHPFLSKVMSKGQQ